MHNQVKDGQTHYVTMTSIQLCLFFCFLYELYQKRGLTITTCKSNLSISKFSIKHSSNFIPIRPSFTTISLKKYTPYLLLLSSPQIIDFNLHSLLNSIINICFQL